MANNINIYEFLKMLHPTYLYISVFIEESCGMDEWTTIIYEGYVDEFICNLYDLENKYHVKEVYICYSRLVEIYLEEN